jgi:integrase
VSFHTFRHYHLTRLFIDEGWNAKQVAAQAGHADAGFTLRTYVHLLPHDLPERASQPVRWGNRGATSAPETGREADTAAAAESGQ